MTEASGGGSRSRGGRPPSDAAAPSELPKTHPMGNLASHRKFLANFATFYAADQSGDVGAITLTWENISDKVPLGTDQGRYLRKS